MQKTIRRILGIFIALVFLMSNAVCISAKAPDIDSHWAQEVIASWMEQDLIDGYEDNSFRPDNPVKRAEFIAFVNRVLRLIEMSSSSFIDVPENAWYKEDVLKAVEAGMISGYGDGKFKPDDYITRQEASVVLFSAFELEAHGDAPSSGFKDSGKISSWAQKAVNSLFKKGYIKGRADNNFAPSDKITRAEAVAMINNIMGTLIKNKGEFTNSVKGNLVVNTPDVTLKNMEIEGDLYLAQGIGEGDVTLDNVTVKGKTIVKGGGSNSIILNNSRANGGIVVNKKSINKKVRIVAQGSTEIAKVDVKSPAKLQESDLHGKGFGEVSVSVVMNKNVFAKDADDVELEGEFGDVSINTEGSKLNLLKGTIQTLSIDVKTEVNLKGGTVQKLDVKAPATASVVNVFKDVVVNVVDIFSKIDLNIEGIIDNVKILAGASDTNVNVAEGANVTEITIDAKIKVTGNGNIAKATINAADVSIEKKPESVVVGNNGSGTVGGDTIGSNTTPTETTAGGSSGGGGGSVSTPKPSTTITTTPATSPTPTATTTSATSTPTTTPPTTTAPTTPPTTTAPITPPTTTPAISPTPLASPAVVAELVTEIREEYLDGFLIGLSLQEETFRDGITVSDSVYFTLNNVPANVTVAESVYIYGQKAFAKLGYGGSGIGEDITDFTITIDGEILTGGNNLTTEPMAIYAKKTSSTSVNLGAIAIGLSETEYFIDLFETIGETDSVIDDVSYEDFVLIKNYGTKEQTMINDIILTHCIDVDEFVNPFEYIIEIDESEGTSFEEGTYRLIFNKDGYEIVFTDIDGRYFEFTVSDESPYLSDREEELTVTVNTKGLADGTPVRIYITDDSSELFSETGSIGSDTAQISFALPDTLQVGTYYYMYIEVDGLINYYGLSIVDPVDSISMVTGPGSDEIIEEMNITLEDETYHQLWTKISPETANQSPTAVVWTSSNTSVAQVNENGFVTALDPGTTIITATSVYDETKSASCTVNVYPDNVLAIDTADVSVSKSEADIIFTYTFGEASFGDAISTPYYMDKDKSVITIGNETQTVSSSVYFKDVTIDAEGTVVYANLGEVIENLGMSFIPEYIAFDLFGRFPVSGQSEVWHHNDNIYLSQDEMDILTPKADITILSATDSKIEFEISQSVYGEPDVVDSLSIDDFILIDSAPNLIEGIQLSGPDAGTFNYTILPEEGSFFADGQYRLGFVKSGYLNDHYPFVIDTTAPVFNLNYPTSGEAQENGSKSVEALIMLDEASTVYYVGVENRASVPSASQIEAGKDSENIDALAKGSKAVTANVETSFAITFPADDTEYDIYFVAQDVAGNLSAVVKLDLRTPINVIKDYGFNEDTMGWEKGWGGAWGAQELTHSSDLGALAVDVNYTGGGWDEATFKTNVSGAWVADIDEITYDVYIPISCDGSILVRSDVAIEYDPQNIGSGITYTLSSQPTVTIGESQYKKISHTTIVPASIGTDSRNKSEINGFLISLIGKNATYSGPIYVDNFKVKDMPDNSPVIVKEYNFNDSTAMGWVYAWGTEAAIANSTAINEGALELDFIENALTNAAIKNEIWKDNLDLAKANANEISYDLYIPNPSEFLGTLVVSASVTTNDDGYPTVELEEEYASYDVAQMNRITINGVEYAVINRNISLDAVTDKSKVVAVNISIKGNSNSYEGKLYIDDVQIKQ